MEEEKLQVKNGQRATDGVAGALEIWSKDRDRLRRLQKFDTLTGCCDVLNNTYCPERVVPLVE